MNKSQAIAGLAAQLAEVTTTEHAYSMLQRALRLAGLTHVTSLTNADMTELLSALASEGGLAQSIAERIAIEGLDMQSGSNAA